MEILQKTRNNAEFMCDGASAQEALLAAQNSKLALQLPDVQKHIATIRSSQLEYRSELSLDIASGFQVFRRCNLDSARENVQSR